MPSDAMPPISTTFVCAQCHEEHDLAELSFGEDAPAPWWVLTEKEREDSMLTPDQCVIHAREESHCFLRACLYIPIPGTDESFSWGVWGSLSERSFGEVSEHWDDPDRIHIGPHFTWLCTAIPTYPDTMYLKAMLHQRAVGTRPLLVLEPTTHPLSVHQHAGIEASVLQALAIRLLHDE